MKRIIIITGASSGIGQEFARQIMDFRQAQELWLVARREERLKEVAAALTHSWKQMDAERTPSCPAVRIIPQDIAGRGGYQLFPSSLQKRPSVGSSSSIPSSTMRALAPTAPLPKPRWSGSLRWWS